MRAGYPDASGMTEVQITNPAGGILGGDRLCIKASLASGSAATVLTQGATKVYKGETAWQDAVFEVDDDALLEYLPHHLIPYAGSSYKQTTEFRLAEKAALVAWDACAAGRVARGERFAFGSLAGKMRIFRNGVPEVVDGFELSAGSEPFGGYSYLGAMYVVSPENLSALAENLHGVLSAPLASATAPSPNLCVARILARNATSLYRALNACRSSARSFLGLPPPPREVW